MPSLIDMWLPKAFEYRNDVTLKGSTPFILFSQLDTGDFYSFFNTQTPEMYEYCMSILRGSDETTDLVIGSSVCPFANVTVLDLSVYPRLKSLRIGNNGFEYVNRLRLIGLNELESVEIGMNSFTKEEYESDPNRHFYLKNCPKLKSLKIGRYSFSDYKVIEIENVDGLEVIEMGDLNEWSHNFYGASLEFKSILIQSE